MGFFPRTWAVFGMLRDKDIAGVVDRLRTRIDRWLVASLEGPRGETGDGLAAILQRAAIAPDAIERFSSVAEAYARARDGCGEDGRILVFGSFLTVADAMHEIEGASG
jgi:dihydrofolate synthase/folylpolyglutamate synthase